MHLAMLPTPKLKALVNGTNLGNDSIESIQKRAKALKAIVDNHFVTVRGQVSPNYKALASTNVKNNIINFHQGLESYPEMFGSLEYANCPEFDSVLSPAAYLVDLTTLYRWVYLPYLKILRFNFKTRRPDIWEIHLNNYETVTEFPYLEVVNSVLTTKIKKDRNLSNALLTMAESVYPFNLPFNAPLQEIRSYLETFKNRIIRGL